MLADTPSRAQSPSAPPPPAPETAAAAAPTPLKKPKAAPTRAPQGISHSQTVDETWFRNVHHSVLSDGGEFRTSALTLALSPRHSADTATSSDEDNQDTPPPRTFDESDAGTFSSRTSTGSESSQPDGDVHVSPSARSLTRENSSMSSSGRGYNSCWTIFVDSTIVKPNLESTLRWYGRTPRAHARALSTQA